MVIVCGGTKGGTGKSTLATSLAVLSATIGERVSLVDADEQQTSYDFTQLRAQRNGDGPGYFCSKQSGMGVRHAVLELEKHYDTVIIDAGGRDTTSQRAALSVANLLLVPILPRSFDLWTLENVNEIVEEVSGINPRLRAFTLLNRADVRGRLTGLSRVAITEAQTSYLHFSEVVISNRIAFATAAALGIAVTEMGTPDPKACEELNSLHQFVTNMKELSKSYD